ncbi:MAG: 30S ribosomal protein S6 [Acidithiobacillales bacterium]
MPGERLYDMVFLVTPEKDEEGTAAVVDEFRKLLNENGAVFQKDESMGRRRLAFTIRKKTEATYHNFLFTAAASGVREVERKMGLSEDVLRYLTVRVDEEMRHGQKVARKTKPRLPRRTEPVAHDAPAPAPDAPPADGTAE